MIFLISTCALALIQIKPLLIEAFDAKKQLDKTMMNENEKNAIALKEPKIKLSKKKKQTESDILAERLKSLNIPVLTEVTDMDSEWTSQDLHTLVSMCKASVNDEGTIQVNFYTEDFSTDNELRNYVFKWTKEILVQFADSKSDVSYYALSFYRRTEFESMDHLALFRGDRSTILKYKNEDDYSFIKKLGGGYLSRHVTKVNSN